MNIENLAGIRGRHRIVFPVRSDKIRYSINLNNRYNLNNGIMLYNTDVIIYCIVHIHGFINCIM